MQMRERRGAPELPVAQNPRHRQRRVVVQHRSGCCSASLFDPLESKGINTLSRQSASNLRAEQQHQPLNRQRDRYAREGVDLSLSTLADQVGTCAVALKPLHDLIAAHVLAASNDLHGSTTRLCRWSGQGQDRHGAGLGLCA